MSGGGGGGGEEGILMSRGRGEEGSVMTLGGGEEGSVMSLGGDHPQLTPADEPGLDFFFEKHQPSVVSVATNELGKSTFYGTGFVLMRDGNSCVIMTSAEHMEAGRCKKFTVYWSKIKPHAATILGYKPRSKFMFLVVRNIPEDVAAVTFSESTTLRKPVITFGTLAGTKLHSNAEPVSLVSVLGMYKGIIIDDNLEAFDSSGNTIVGSESYFTLSCSFQDKNVDIDKIDDEKHDKLHTARLILSAPIFDLFGKMVGIVYSKGDVPGVKIGLHVKYIYQWVNKVCGTTTTNWKENLKAKMQEQEEELKAQMQESQVKRRSKKAKGNN